MTKLGLDFDNTIITYDTLFARIARKDQLIPESSSWSKVQIRDYLRSQDKEGEFTLLQGKVYGEYISMAEAAPFALDTLRCIENSGLRPIIISHKTKYPYKGPKLNLHDAALKWLECNHFFSADEYGLNWDLTRVFFEETKQSKVDRIVSESCTHYVDDLPEILEMIPPHIVRIHYSPSGNTSWDGGPTLHSWNDLPQLIEQVNH